MVRSGRIAVVLTFTLFTLALSGTRAIRHMSAWTSHVSRTAASASDGGSPPSGYDLLGNEVTQAVATYKLDAAGSLYEEHSPQTEVPRLASPKS